MPDAFQDGLLLEARMAQCGGTGFYLSLRFVSQKKLTMMLDHTSANRSPLRTIHETPGSCRPAVLTRRAMTSAA